MSVLNNKDKYHTLKDAREAYRRWQNGCMRLHWCVLPFDEWLYDRDRSAEMAELLANAEEGR